MNLISLVFYDIMWLKKIKGVAILKVRGFEIVEKRNVLNEIKKSDMTLQELRFFSIYLAKINSRDVSTRVVKFKLEEFKKIMVLREIKLEYFKAITAHLLQKIVTVPSENDPNLYKQFQLFKECELEKNEYGEIYVKFDVHDKALPLIFEFKEKYFKYALWNILRLTSRNQIRMYELLKQYEPIGIREIKLYKLKDWLGISQDEYTRWYDFKKYVLDACQKALLENTDIKYDYELMKTGRRVTGVRFLIKKNEDYKDPLKLEEYINYVSDYEKKPVPLSDERIVLRTKKNKNLGYFELKPTASFTIEDLKNKIEN